MTTASLTSRIAWVRMVSHVVGLGQKADTASSTDVLEKSVKVKRTSLTISTRLPARRNFRDEQTGRSRAIERKEIVHVQRDTDRCHDKDQHYMELVRHP